MKHGFIPAPIIYYLFPSDFKAYTPNITIISGQSAKLTCEAEGSPVISWRYANTTTITDNIHNSSPGVSHVVLPRVMSDTVCYIECHIRYSMLYRVSYSMRYVIRVSCPIRYVISSVMSDTVCYTSVMSDTVCYIECHVRYGILYECHVRYGMLYECHVRYGMLACLSIVRNVTSVLHNVCYTLYCVYTVHCTVYSLQYTACTLLSVHCSLFSVHCTPYSLHKPYIIFKLLAA